MTAAARSADLPRRRAAIVDVDGTLTVYSADRENRARDSKPRPEVIEVVHALWLAGSDLVFVTARPHDRDWDDTYLWIRHHVFNGWRFPVEWLHLKVREVTDDVTWKAWLYRNHIEPRWDVRIALDDLERSVQVWRDLGITVLQVRADGAKD